jgi:hypothetical protein
VGVAVLDICIYESRPENAIGIKLLVLSIAQHEPTARLHLFVDHMAPELRAWLARQPNVILGHLECDPTLGWNVKPKHLLHLLNSGLSSVIWFDSDIIVTRPFGQLVTAGTDKILILAEEYFAYRNQGVAVRTAGWGLPPGQDLSFTPNTCILRTSRAHCSLLRAWQDLLDREDYVALQRRFWSERPFYMIGDQDALSALLGSREFMDIEVRRLRRGHDIAQCFGADGYGPMERIAALWRGMPPFIHAQGEKPWHGASGKRVHQSLSPYRLLAAAYASLLEPDERIWLLADGGMARVLRSISGGHPAVSGLVPSAAARIKKRCQAIWRLIRAAGRRTRVGI